jgi:outer membrane protein assembly factor BamB
MGRTGNVFCLDAETGELLWRFSIKHNLVPEDYFGKYDYGSRQIPVIWQGKVYANLFWHGYPEISGMHCFDLATGTVLWRKLAGYVKARYSPNVADGRLVYTSNCNIAPAGSAAVYQPQVCAWDAVTGDSLWTFVLGSSVTDACWQIAVHDTIFAAIAGRNVALDKNGNMIWQDILHSSNMTTMSYYQGKLFIGGGSTGNTVLLNSSDGSFIRSDATPGYLVPVFTENRY